LTHRTNGRCAFARTDGLLELDGLGKRYGDVALDGLTLEVAGALAVTLGATALLIPLAARICRGGVMRTGAALKLREAWRA
jgi:hypothetical protein